MRLILIALCFITILSCSVNNDHQKAIINFKTQQSDFNNLKNILADIAIQNNMHITNSSYMYGTEERPEQRLIIHLKDTNNLEIYTNCYSDWEKCSIEFLCYQVCLNVNKLIDQIRQIIANKWEITKFYVNDNVKQE